MPFLSNLSQLAIVLSDSNGGLVTTTPPSYIGVYIAGLLTFVSGVALFLAQGERERRRRESDIKTKNDEQMAAVNQSLTLLLSKQADTTADLTVQAAQMKALETKQSAYDVSLALLKQEIEQHIRTSEEDRRRLHDNITAVRDGLISDRRASERKDR